MIAEIDPSLDSRLEIVLLIGSRSDPNAFRADGDLARGSLSSNVDGSRAEASATLQGHLANIARNLFDNAFERVVLADKTRDERDSPVFCTNCPACRSGRCRHC